MATTITESFNTADGDTLGPLLTWVEDVNDIDIVSNRARVSLAAAPALARATNLLDTANHYVQAVVSCNLTTEGSPGIIARKANSSTQDYYLVFLKYNTGGAGQFLAVDAVVGGVFTLLGSNVPITLVATTQYTLRLQCDGSAITAYVDTVLKQSQTDTTVVGNLATGIRGDFTTVGGTAQVEWDGFTAGDIVVPTLRPQIWM